MSSSFVGPIPNGSNGTRILIPDGGTRFQGPRQGPPTVESIRAGLLGGGRSPRRARTDSRLTVAPAATLNQQPTITEAQRQVRTRNQPIPLVYGQAQIGGKPFAVDYADGIWTVGYVVCLGEIDGFEQVWLNDEAPVAGVTINYYTGTTGQTADPLLAAAITDYSDTLVISRNGMTLGIAYIVVQFTVEHYQDWPRVVVEVRGKRVRDVKNGGTVYSTNPVLHLVDVLESDFYGHGYTIDDASAIVAQDYADDTTLGEVRRRGFAVFDRLSDTDLVIDQLRTYAGCFVVIRGDTVRLIADQAASSVRTFTADDVIRDSLRIIKSDSAQLPTVVEVQYTDTSTDIWRTRYADAAMLPGVSTGATPRRVSRITLTGVNRHSQAYREAVERLNKLQLSDLIVEFSTFDEALALEQGDVITLTHPYGLTNKLLRITEEPIQTSPGRWSIVAAEYDPAAYSNEVQPQPTYTDGNLPSGQEPDAPTGLTVTETTYQLQNGKFVSRLNISWTASTDIFVTSYGVKVTDNLGAVVYSANTGNNAVATPPLRELVPYTVEVKALTPTQESATVTDTLSIIGKTAIPDAPASLSGFEAGGEVRLSWPASTDVDAERYEVRYGSTGGSWDTATSLDITDGLRLQTKDVPEGTWRFYVRTIDSIQQYSTGEATVDLTVTLDNDAFLAGSIDPLSVHQTATNMHVVKESRTSDVEVAYTDSGQSVSTVFGASALSTFPNELISYQAAPYVTWASETLDLGQDQSGNFKTTLPDHEVYNGSLNANAFGLQADGVGSYTWDSQLSRQAVARYARTRLVGTMNIKVTLPSGSIRADVVAQEETGSGTSLASGATTITLSKKYAAARSLVITPSGTASRVAVYDNIQLDNGGVTTFDVYIFNSAGTQVANDFLYQWKGV